MSIEESYGDADRVFRRGLGGTALAYTVCHHLGLLPDGLGAGPRGSPVSHSCWRHSRSR